MVVEVLGRLVLEPAIRDQRTLRKTRRLLELQEELDFVEVGGEFYLSGNPTYVRLRALPHSRSHFDRYFKELKEGRYAHRHFQEMLREGRCWTKNNPEWETEWERLVEEMEVFRDNGRMPKDAARISERYRYLLGHTYSKPICRRLRKGNYSGNFHVHNNGSPPSKNDIQIGQTRPELVIIYNRNNNLTIGGEVKRTVSFVYLHPLTVSTRTGITRREAAKYTFGPYII